MRIHGRSRLRHNSPLRIARLRALHLDDKPRQNHCSYQTLPPCARFGPTGTLIEGAARLLGACEPSYQTLRLSSVKLLDYFFTPKTASFAALATRNLTTVLAGILIFCCVFGLKPVRAFLFCFTSLPKPGKTNSPFFLISL